MRRSSLFIRIVVVCLFIGLGVIVSFAQTDAGEGSLHVIGADGKEVGLCPLKRTDVNVEISGFVSRVTVTQVFQNPFDRPIEALYTFPLSNDGAVDDMTIQVADRLVRGKVMERIAAQQAYDRAKQEGKT